MQYCGLLLRVDGHQAAPGLHYGVSYDWQDLLDTLLHVDTQLQGLVPGVAPCSLLRVETQVVEEQPVPGTRHGCHTETGHSWAGHTAALESHEGHCMRSMHYIQMTDCVTP